METSFRIQPTFRRHIALPQDHGSWIFLISPLLIGIFAKDSLVPETGYLVLAAFAAFLIRQPVTIAIKAYSGRRARSDLPIAYFWIVIYGLVGLSALSVLVLRGYWFLFYLALPAIPVFAWHLVLVSRRLERRQAGVEILGSGVLALAAPAAYWVGLQGYDPVGWWLFGLVWLQSAASIVYAYLRLAQRELTRIPEISTRIQMGYRALAYTSFNLIAVLVLSVSGLLPSLLPLPYFLQWGETMWGVFHPAVGIKPKRIGVRQLIVSTVFTLMFILTWK